jgi:TusA-related sulfurtransferase
MKTIDLTNTIPPFALLEIANCIRELAPGKAVKIIGLDAGTLHDLRCIFPNEDQAVTSLDIFSQGEGKLAICIEKRAAG